MRLAAVLLMLVACSGRAQSGRTITASPEPPGSSAQQLVLKGVRGDANTAGVQVYLNPGKQEKLSASSSAYVSTVFFSHRREGERPSEDFAVTLPQTVNKSAQVVLVSVNAGGKQLDSPPEVASAVLKAVDNSQFR